MHSRAIKTLAPIACAQWRAAWLAITGPASIWPMPMGKYHPAPQVVQPGFTR